MCQKIRIAHKRYRVTIGAENTKLDAKVYVDFMYIEVAPVLHLVDNATHFNAAQFVESLTTESVWGTIHKLQATVYTGLPNTLFMTAYKSEILL